MKAILTRRHKLTTLEISLLGLLGAAVSTASVFTLRVRPVDDFPVLAKAAENTAAAFARVKEARAAALMSGVDSINDPAGSGLIGSFHSAITTGAGNLEAKQTSINPNWAALVVRYLQQAGVRPGDPVAVGLTGSYPALNIAVLEAIETYGAVPLWIVSQGSTAWGANHPALTFLDMEHALAQAGLLHGRALAATLGGNNNAGAELDEEGRSALRGTIARRKVPFLDATPLSAAVDSQFARFTRASGGRRIPLYINVGAGYASLGTMNAATLLATGLNPPAALLDLQGEPVEGVAAKFLAQGAHVLNLYDIEGLARRQGLPVAPAVTPLPGTGKLFYAPAYSLWINAALLAAFVAAVLAFANGITTFLTGNPRKREML
jgi:poly-gamma-glutamate system protein